MWQSKDRRTERGPGPTCSGALLNEKPAKHCFFSAATSLGWFCILAQMLIIEWMMCKWAWMHQEWVSGKESCLQGAVWQSKYLLKDKLMTVPCKWWQIHYWNESQFFGLILSKDKSQTWNTSVCVCVCVYYTFQQIKLNMYQITKVGKSLNLFSWNILPEF